MLYKKKEFPSQVLTVLWSCNWGSSEVKKQIAQGRLHSEDDTQLVCSPVAVGLGGAARPQLSRVPGCGMALALNTRHY